MTVFVLTMDAKCHYCIDQDMGKILGVFENKKSAGEAVGVVFPATKVSGEDFYYKLDFWGDCYSLYELEIGKMRNNDDSENA